MEYGLRRTRYLSVLAQNVLILVVMEILCKSDEQSQARLSYAMTQPKFSSEIWSQTHALLEISNARRVLILVVMEISVLAK